MTAPACIKYETCSAPLCPLDASSLSNCAWYADEETCSKRGLPHWVLRQRKIARVCDESAGFFTHKMLRHNCVIGSAMRGLNPDGWADELPQEEAKWFGKHPVKPPKAPVSQKTLDALARGRSVKGERQKEALSMGSGAPNP